MATLKNLKLRKQVNFNKLINYGVSLAFNKFDNVDVGIVSNIVDKGISKYGADDNKIKEYLEKVYLKIR